MATIFRWLVVLFMTCWMGCCTTVLYKERNMVHR